MKEENIIKQFITHKKAKNIQRRIKKIGNLWWGCTITDKLTTTGSEKKLEIKIPKLMFNSEDFTELIEILMEEAIRYRLYFFSRRNENGGLEVEMDIKR